MRQYLTNTLKCDTSSDGMKEKIKHWLGCFEKFQKKYIIMPIKSYNSYFPEEIRYTSVRSPPVFIIQENETRCYFNATIQILYSNVLFRKLMLNIYCFTMIICLNNNIHYFYHYQKIMIMKELQKLW